MQVTRDIPGLSTLAEWILRFLDPSEDHTTARRARSETSRTNHLRNEDAKLVADALGGRRGSMDILIRRLKPEMIKIARLMSENRHDADVLAEKLFLRVFRSLKHYRARKPLVEWSAQTAIAAGLHTAETTVGSPENWNWTETDIQLLNDINDSVYGVSPARASRLLDRLFDHLTPAERLVKRLHDLDGDSIEKICQWTGWSEPKVTGILHGAGQRVDEILRVACTGSSASTSILGR